MMAHRSFLKMGRIILSLSIVHILMLAVARKKIMMIAMENLRIMVGFNYGPEGIYLALRQASPQLL